MCWYGRKKNLKVAKKDIKVKKVLNKEFLKKCLVRDKSFTRIISPYQGSCYEVGETYEEKINPSESVNVEIAIGRGLHCYSNKCPYSVKDDGKMVGLVIGKKPNFLTRIIFGNKVTDLNMIGVFSSDEDSPAVDSFRTLILAQFIIPAGTRYYENDSGEIVTEKYIFKDYIEL
jgi:hypothetical protein